MTKKIEFVTYTTTGRSSAIVEFDDDETEDDINERFLEWVCNENNAGWGEVGE